MSRYSTKTLIGMHPDDTTPFAPADGRKSGVRSTQAFELVRRGGRTVMLSRPTTVRVFSATPFFVAAGLVFFITAAIVAFF